MSDRNQRRSHTRHNPARSSIRPHRCKDRSAGRTRRSSSTSGPRIGGRPCSSHRRSRSPVRSRRRHRNNLPVRMRSRSRRHSRPPVRSRSPAHNHNRSSDRGRNRKARASHKRGSPTRRTTAQSRARRLAMKFASPVPVALAERRSARGECLRPDDKSSPQTRRTARQKTWAVRLNIIVGPPPGRAAKPLQSAFRA